MKVPDAVGVPLRVSTLVKPFQFAITPAGRLTGDPMPVAPVVVRMMLGSSGVLIHRVGLLEGVPAVLIFTVIRPVAFTVPQPPVRGML